MNLLIEVSKAVSLGLLLLLPLANPLTTVALFIGLTGNFTNSQRQWVSIRTSVYVFIIMTAAFYAGQAIMDAFGISLPGLRVAGGLIVMFIGFRMLFPSANETKVDNILHDSSPADIAFIPLAMPSTAGPGTIAMIISSVSTIQTNDLGFSSITMTIAPVITFFVISFIIFIGLKSSSWIIRIIGKSGIDAISRLMGFLLVCMGTQFIINGVLDIAS